MPVIFISRGTMSGVHRLVGCLHDRSGIRCISREDLVKIVNQHGGLATRIVEKLATAVSAYDQFSGLRWPYIVLLRQALLEEIRHDNVVYHGYSAHLLIPPLCHFVRIRIGAPMYMRVKISMENMKCDEEKAREYITEEDDHTVKWARFMYAQDIRQSMQYDLILNMGHMSLDAACGVIENLMKEPGFQSTPESQAEVDRLYLSTNIEKELVTDPRTATTEISADVRKDGISLIGPYLDEPELDIVMEIAKSVPGADNIQYVPGYAPKLEIGSNL